MSERWPGEPADVELEEKDELDEEEGEEEEADEAEELPRLRGPGEEPQHAYGDLHRAAHEMFNRMHRLDRCVSES